MAPAYFTKLIFFLRGADVADTGYIMDQWAGCSVNILTGDPCAVLMNATYTWKVPKKGPKKLAADFQVSEHNTAEDYERFCRVVDEIAVITKLPPHDAELLLMSEGKGKGAWRKYVVDNRRLPATIPLFVKSESR